MISGDSFSRVSVTCPHGKVDTPKPRNAGPNESPHSGPYTRDAGWDYPNGNNKPDWKLSRPDWAVFGSEVTRVALDGILMQVFRSDVTTISPDGILRQGQWLPTPKRPPEVRKGLKPGLPFVTREDRFLDLGMWRLFRWVEGFKLKI
ncbi:hypothetical protein CRG98_010278 [Punica granatum]|uniref:Uncharacterized protein n=1 Tax=Punica granatum TaxID=22663 RepID=A0A2I0KLH4_PUNGR|nr:hypothetical protein CRG98_010278 [Punica granatum]